MKLKLDPRHLSLILTSFAVLGIPSCVCQDDELYQKCSQPFHCSWVSYIGYPFYGGDRPVSCGYPGFEINCYGDEPLLNISSIFYRVVAVDNSTQTLRVSRNDMRDNLCPRFLYNTTLDFRLFDFHSPANDQNITVYYGCSVNQMQPSVPPNQFNCNVNDTNSLSFFVTGDPSSLGTGITCNSQISVRVNQTVAEDLANITVTSRNLLQDALRSGFSIKWLADNENCNNCVRSGGLCGYDQDLASFACHCTNGSYVSTCNGRRIVKDKLGQGGYGIVYKGNLSDGQPVAVKVLTETHDNAEEFVNEVASISRTSHVNIVNLLGFCYERNKRALVYEYMSNKSLDKFIYKSGSVNPECSLEWEKLYEIAVGVARGLEYLHRGCNTRIVHFDIKPQNILLGDDFCPKISDFGLAKLFKEKQSILSVLGARGTIGYIAPEVFSRSFGVVSYKSDVYSYGMMLLEIAEAGKIIEIEATQSNENYSVDEIYEHVLLKNERLGDLVIEEREETARKMLLVGLWCIQTAPSDRPSMIKVVEMLEGSLESIQIPPKPFLYIPKLSRRRFSSSFSINVETESSTEC